MTCKCLNQVEQASMLWDRYARTPGGLRKSPPMLRFSAVDDAGCDGENLSTTQDYRSSQRPATSVCRARRRLESAFSMSAVAKWHVLRLAATTNGNHWLIAIVSKGIAFSVQDLDRTLNQQRAIVPNANRDIRRHDRSFPSIKVLIGENTQLSHDPAAWSQAPRRHYTLALQGSEPRMKHGFSRMGGEVSHG